MTRGSPPHTRGIHSCTSACLPFTGFTPAYAGNTLSGHVHPYALWVHPRIRGEYCRSGAQQTADTGSPPHTRGIPRTRLTRYWSGRFTPAYAGNTLLSHCRTPQMWVHPRIRGEYSYVQGISKPFPGSPPHTRGIRDGKNFKNGMKGFTPAYAGNTGCLLSHSVLREVHPRIRGEYPGAPALCSVWGGSPPHTRGILSRWFCAAMYRRFTPAYAGNTKLMRKV